MREESYLLGGLHGPRLSGEINMDRRYACITLSSGSRVEDECRRPRPFMDSFNGQLLASLTTLSMTWFCVHGGQCNRAPSARLSPLYIIVYAWILKNLFFNYTNPQIINKYIYTNTGTYIYVLFFFSCWHVHSLSFSSHLVSRETRRHYEDVDRDAILPPHNPCMIRL